jgi:hypothetical protein
MQGEDEMVATVRNKEFNIRVLFTETGEPVIGNVQGFYHVDSNITDIKPVPDSTIQQIAKALGIKKSSRNLALGRKLSKAAKAVDASQYDLFEIA